MGSFNNAPTLPIGASVGQVGQAQPSGANALFETYDPKTLSAIAGGTPWTSGGTLTYTSDTANQFSAGFVPQNFNNLTSGAADFIQSPIPAALTAQPLAFTVSAQVCADPQLNSPFATVSPSCRVSLRWLDVANALWREDFVTFNPVTGQMYDTQNVTRVIIDKFASDVAVLATGAANPITVTQISFVTSAPGVWGNTKVVLRFYPNIPGNGGRCIAGGFDAKQGTVSSAFQPTSDAKQTLPIYTRPLGAIPREVVDTRKHIMVPTGNFVVDLSPEGNGIEYLTSGQIINVPAAAADGQTFDVFVYGGVGSTTFIFAGSWALPGDTVNRGAGSLTLPWDGASPAAGGPTDCYAATFTYSAAASIWAVSFGLGAGGASTGTPTQEIPTGAIDGVNRAYMLSGAASVVEFYLNGLILRAGGVDYTLVGNTVTVTVANTPQVGDNVYAVWWN